MNQIKVGRIIVAGFIVFVVFILMELVVEEVIGRAIVGDRIIEWYLTIGFTGWTTSRYILNVALGLLNCTLLIWLYAALRPMFGVGLKTVLIASGFMIFFVTSFIINFTNLGAIPPGLVIFEIVAEAIETPVALYAGAYFYEGGQ